MEVQLSWDIIFLALIVVVFGVAFIRPHKFTLRLLLGTYLSLIIAEGAAFFLEGVILPAAPALQSWVSENGIFFFMGVRLILFFVALSLFIIRGHYQVEHKKHDHWLARSIIHISFAALTSLLFVTSVFSFLSGNSFIESLLNNFAPNPWFDSSIVVEMALQSYGVWLALPAIGMLVASIVHPRNTD